MNVLILSSEIGGGHSSAAAAVLEELDRQGHSGEIVDVIDLISNLAGLLVENIHIFLYRYAPGLFNFGYDFSEKHADAAKKRSAFMRLMNLGRKKLFQIIRDGSYDAIFCTHVFAALMLTLVREKAELPMRTSLLATDYTCSPGVEKSRMDGYFIPDADLTEEFVKKGVPREKLVVTGMPVSADFHSRTPLAQAKQALGLKEEQRHLLMMSGSMGSGPIRELTELLAKKLPGNAALTVCCGTNASLLHYLQHHFEGVDNIRLLGYTDQIASLMDSADLCLTKPGGLSISEAMAKQLPLCLIHAVDGCERPNAEFFLRRGMAVSAPTEEELAEISVELLLDEDRLAEMREAMERSYPGNAAGNIVRWLADAGNDPTIGKVS